MFPVHFVVDRVLETRAALEQAVASRAVSSEHSQVRKDTSRQFSRLSRS